MHRAQVERAVAAGDALLRSTAAVIKRSLRTIDLAARMGGDEFAVLLPETAAEGARATVNKLHRELLKAAEQGGWRVTFSTGVLICVTCPEDLEIILNRADRLMYAAKNSEAECVVFGDC